MMASTSITMRMFRLRLLSPGLLAACELNCWLRSRIAATKIVSYCHKTLAYSLKPAWIPNIIMGSYHNFQKNYQRHLRRKTYTIKARRLLQQNSPRLPQVTGHTKTNYYGSTTTKLMNFYCIHRPKCQFLQQLICPPLKNAKNVEWEKFKYK